MINAAEAKGRRLDEQRLLSIMLKVWLKGQTAQAVEEKQIIAELIRQLRPFYEQTEAQDSMKGAEEGKMQ